MEIEGLTPSKCKGCGKKMYYGKDLNGNKVPLDATAYPIYYFVNEGQAKHVDGMPVIERVPNALISHFVTCPRREQFSRGKSGPA